MTTTIASRTSRSRCNEGCRARVGARGARRERRERPASRTHRRDPRSRQPHDTRPGHSEHRGAGRRRDTDARAACRSGSTAARQPPVLRFEDGYGFTYGARAAVVSTLGSRSRISAPFTWGGERRAGVEVERAFDRGPLSIIRATAAIDRRVNPHFNVSDSRRDVGVQADRALAGWLRVGGDARVADVTFGGLPALHRTAGAHVVVDTRLDPSFPRNALLASASIERIAFEGGRASRWSTDLRGYLGLYRGSVLALRARTVRADTPLPPSEQTLLGGSDSLRGYRAGYLSADGIAATSAELRVPFTSPLTIGRFGMKLFADAATTWPAGTSLTTRHFDQGNGGGLYFGAALFTANVDIAFPRRGTARWHFGLGVSF
ncbi:MAG: hypothetical protein DMF87_17405 [Acidobacteria bacterium]|nr:MAG: hypothetical protein DMF87_17405 [Acidobacteriota bacterium]